MEETARCPLRVLAFAASLRGQSLNVRLVSLVEGIVTRHGAEVVHASMRDFDCPSYDGDVEASSGIPAGAQKLREALQGCDAFISAYSSRMYGATFPAMTSHSCSDSGTFWRMKDQCSAVRS
jgi:chromate reductase, NAD(P)H dehydrogenase (quinone)